MAEINKIYEEGMAAINDMAENSSTATNGAMPVVMNQMEPIENGQSASMDSLGAEPETR